MSNYLKIRNTKFFAKSIRKNVAMIFPESYSDQLDSLISINQTEILAKKYIEPAYNDDFIISDRNYDMLFDEVKKWIYNRSLSQLASSDNIECAWDDDSNEMIFWDPKSNHTFNIIK